MKKYKILNPNTPKLMGSDSYGIKTTVPIKVEKIHHSLAQ